MSSASLAQSFDYDEPLNIFFDTGPVNATEYVAVGDVNGDGLADIVASIGEPSDAPPQPRVGYLGRVGIMLQRPNGQFDFPILYQCHCQAGQIKLVDRDGTPAKEIIYSSLVDDPNLPKGGFGVIDVGPTGALTAQRYVDGELYVENYSTVDVDQDGHDDIFYTYEDDDETTPAVEYRYVIWYNHGGGKFTQYTSNRFVYSGINIFSGNFDTPAVQQQHLDLNADGYYDAIEGWCPSLCLFRQEPYRQLVASPITGSAGVTYGYTYGDLNGDGLPDRIFTMFGSESVAIELQTSANTFTNVGNFSPVFLPGPATIADLDNNGLADFAIGTEQALVYFLQTSPGTFQPVSKLVLPNLISGNLLIGDFNGDSCPDLIATGSQYNFFLYFRGEHCAPAGDLKVTSVSSDHDVTVSVANIAGAKTFADRIVRVDIAPSLKDDSALSLVVTAPSQCTAVPARAPLRLFDCHTGTLAPAQQTSLAFQLSLKTVNANWVAIQSVAFLLDGSGDSNGLNNRARSIYIFSDDKPVTRPGKPPRPIRGPSRQPGGSLATGRQVTTHPETNR
jgi:hypothetical protein